MLERKVVFATRPHRLRFTKPHTPVLLCITGGWQYDRLFPAPSPPRHNNTLSQSHLPPYSRSVSLGFILIVICIISKHVTYRIKIVFWGGAGHDANDCLPCPAGQSLHPSGLGLAGASCGQSQNSNCLLRASLAGTSCGQSSRSPPSNRLLWPTPYT